MLTSFNFAGLKKKLQPGPTSRFQLHNHKIYTTNENCRYDRPNAWHETAETNNVRRINV